MTCRKCGDATATVHLTESRDDGTHLELHLCDPCARTWGLVGELSSTISDLLASLGAGPTPNDEGSYLVTPLDCERCGRGHATIHLFEAFHGGERERHLCESCGRFAAGVVDSVFAERPRRTPAPPPSCPRCGQIRFDYIRIAGPIRRDLRAAALPIRILLRGCAWSPP